MAIISTPLLLKLLSSYFKFNNIYYYNKVDK
jgi:hypothetical protein